jgi:hypothetical protein
MWNHTHPCGSPALSYLYSQILKFCFYVFDKDKNGFIEEDELKMLLALLHDNQQEKGNLGVAIKKVPDIV